jgi:hypothetical protein
VAAAKRIALASPGVEPEAGIEPTTYRLQDSPSELSGASTCDNVHQVDPTGRPIQHRSTLVRATSRATSTPTAPGDPLPHSVSRRLGVRRRRSDRRRGQHPALCRDRLGDDATVPIVRSSSTFPSTSRPCSDALGRPASSGTRDLGRRGRLTGVCADVYPKRRRRRASARRATPPPGAPAPAGPAPRRSTRHHRDTAYPGVARPRPTVTRSPRLRNPHH